MFQAVVQAALALAVAFGLNLSPGQAGAMLAFTAAALSFWTLAQVTPTASPKTAQDNDPAVKSTAAHAGH